jgi:ankyrin repeat protein
MLFGLIGLPLSTFSQSSDVFDLVKSNDLTGLKERIALNKALLEARDSNDRTLLHWAARGVHYDMMQFLLESGVDVNVQDRNGIYPITSVVARNHTDALKLLIWYGAAISVPDNEGSYPIHIAAQYGYSEMVKILLDHEPCLEQLDHYDRTPLIVSSREEGDFETVKMLLEQGACINAKDKYEGSALLLAAWRGYENIVNLLLDYHAVIEVGGAEGNKLLQYACDKNLFQLYEKMIQEGADIYSIKSNQQSTLHWASIGGGKEIVKDLIKRGISVSSKDVYGWTPLHYATYFDRVLIAEILLENGADINVKTPLHETPLYFALSNQNAELVKFLKSNGASQQELVYTSLTGEYLGQQNPGNKPEIFAPGIVSRLKGGHSNITFSPDGAIAFWTEWNLSESGYAHGSKILYSKINNGTWTYPRVVVPSGDCPFFSVDGTKMFFRAIMTEVTSDVLKDGIWYYEATDTMFLKPQRLDFEVNEYGLYWQFSFDRYGDLYFGGSDGLYRSKFINGSYAKPEKLTDVCHPDYIGGSPYIAPDGNFLLFNSADLEGSFGSSDLYMGVKNKYGVWSEPLNLGPDINGAYAEILPMMTPDGKYLFYRSNFGNVMWVESTTIKNYLSSINKD